MGRLTRPSWRTFTFLAAAFALTCVAAAVDRYDRSHPIAIAMPSQVLLDTRLAWTTRSFGPIWTPVPGPQNAYVWQRRVPGYAEIDPADQDERQNSVELTGTSRGRLSDWSSPVFGDGRFYVASSSSQHKLFAYDLRLPPVSVRRNLTDYSWTDLQRSPAWERDILRGFDVSGMMFDNGRLYVGIENTLAGSACIMVFNAADGRTVGSASFPAGQLGPAVLVGPPVLGRLPSGEEVVVTALCCKDGSEAVCALDAAAGEVLWTSILEFHPIGPPAVGGGVVVIGGIGTEHRPVIAGLRLSGGKQIWRFESPHVEPYADYGWEPRPVPISDPSRRQPGGVGVATEAATGPIACFACGRRMYAVDLLTGRLRWELAPSIDPQAEKAVNAIVNSPVYPPTRMQLGPEPGELPRAPWLTAPAFHRDELLFGTPDGLWAVATEDGALRWRLRQQEVGAVDLPPLVRNGTAYIASQGWIDGDLKAARMREACAIRLDGPPVSAPTLTAAPVRLRHWPLLAAATALAGLIVAAIERPRPPARRRWWLDGLPVLLVLAAAGVLAGWACLHPPTVQPLRPGDVPVGWQEANGDGSPSTVMLYTLLALVYVAGLLAVWRGRKLLLASTVSLVLGAAVVTLWVRGRRVWERISITTYELRPDRIQQHSTSLMSGRGGLRIDRSEAGASLASGLFDARGNSFSWSRTFHLGWYPVSGPIRSGDEMGTERQWHGFEVQSRVYIEPILKAGSGSASVTVPDWTLLLPFAAILATWLLRLALCWRKRRRARAGRCPVCNYSLTGNISGICPECGTPVFGLQNLPD